VVSFSGLDGVKSGRLGSGVAWWDIVVDTRNSFL
jgi:hypothetical protein